jgi:hypothetical protein
MREHTHKHTFEHTHTHTQTHISCVVTVKRVSDAAFVILPNSKANAFEVSSCSIIFVSSLQQKNYKVRLLKNCQSNVYKYSLHYILSYNYNHSTGKQLRLQ